MKTNVRITFKEALVLALFTVTIFLALHSSKIIWPEHTAAINCYGCFFSLMIIGKIIFRKIVIWEIETSRIRAHYHGDYRKIIYKRFPWSRALLVTAMIMIIFLAIISILKTSPFFNNWLIALGKPLPEICGWPSLLALVVLITLTLNGWLTRRNQLYNWATHRKIIRSQPNYFKIKLDWLDRTAITLAVALLVFLAFWLLGQKIWPAQAVVLNYYGWFFSLMIIGGVIFQWFAIWEVESKRIKSTLQGLMYYKFSWSNLMLRLANTICFLMITVCALNLFSFFYQWLECYSQMLGEIVGWPLFISFIILSILTFGGWYMRDQYGYQPKMTQTAY
ncbi:MAG: hypothetical protein WC523_05785 [Patescibacteria group bacterium]